MPLHTPLTQYILDLLHSQNMSMREGSMRSHLAPETISQIVRREHISTPRPDTLEMLADGLNGSYRRMMNLAGYIEEMTGLEGLEPELKEAVYQLMDRWDQIARLDPSGEGSRQLLTLVTTQAAAYEAAIRAVRGRHESPVLQHG